MKKKMMLAILGTVVVLGAGFGIYNMNNTENNFQGKYLSRNQKLEMIGMMVAFWGAGAVSESQSNLIITSMCNDEIESDSKVGSIAIDMLRKNTDKKMKQNFVEIGRELDCSIF